MSGMQRPRWLGRVDTGATMLEYALMLTLVAVVVTAAVVNFGPAVANLFTDAASSL
jgi:Flp pilus assembly pilin Flp